MLLSTTSIRYLFPVGRYGSVQAFLNAVQAALLGYEVVINAAIVAMLAYLLVRSRGRPGRVVVWRQVRSGGWRELPDDIGS